MITRREDNAFLHSDFYRNKFHKTLKWLIILMIIIFLLIIFGIYLVLFRPPPRYFANTTNGVILEMPVPIRT